MAGVAFDVNGAATTLAASTEKTLLQITAATNQRVVIKCLTVMGQQAAGGTDPVVSVRVTYSTANFGTGTTATPSKRVRTDTETLQTTAKGNFTVEPTSPTDGGKAWRIQPQTGMILPFPPGQEIIVPGGYAVNIAATSSGTPVLTASASCEE